MSAPGLGRAKTSALVRNVEYLEEIVHHRSQIILRMHHSIPCWRIVFSTSRRCMSFHTARVTKRRTHHEQIWSGLRQIATVYADITDSSSYRPRSLADFPKS